MEGQVQDAAGGLSRKCITCGQVYPLTLQYWEKKGNGFLHKCKQCRNQANTTECKLARLSHKVDGTLRKFEEKCLDVEQQLEELRALNENRAELLAEGLRAIGLDALEKFSIRPGSATPHIAELVEALTEVFEGPRGFAAQMAALLHSPNGRFADKVRLLELYSRLVLKNTEMGGAKKPIELLDDEDLQREFERLNNLKLVKDSA